MYMYNVYVEEEKHPGFKSSQLIISKKNKYLSTQSIPNLFPLIPWPCLPSFIYYY